MRPILLALAAGTLSLGAAGCERAGREEKLPAAASAAATLLQPAYRPPPDGLLTPVHLDLYLKVRRASKGRPDADAARAVGVTPEEFAWVRARLVEAGVALEARRVARAAAETYARSLASVKEARRRVTDAATGRALEREIAQLERERASLVKEEALSASLAANVRLLAARRGEIEAVSR